MSNLIQINNKYNSEPPFAFYYRRHLPKYYAQFHTEIHKQNSQNQNKNDEDSAKKHFFSIGISTIIIIGSCLMFSKGLQKTFGKQLDKLKNYLEYHLETNCLEEKSKKSKFFERFARGVTSIISKSESINNITSLKDILFMKLMYKTKPTKMIHKGISDYFDKISRKTIAKSYDKTEKTFKKMERKFQILDDFILKNADSDRKINFKNKEYSIQDIIKLAKSFREETYYAVEIFTSQKAQNRRNAYIKSANAKLYETFWDASFKDFGTSKNKFKTKEMWQTFIAAEQMKGDKTKLANNVAFIKNMITYSNEDRSSAISKYLADLRKSLPKFADEDYKQVKKLEWFVKSPGGLKNNKEIFLEELQKLATPKPFANADLNLVENFNKNKLSYIDMINDLVRDDITGQVQDLISIYYKVAPFEFAKSGALQAIKNAAKSFDKSVNLEISEYFDKVRDLELGSAPTDVLTILLSTGLISKDLLQAKNKDQKTSVVLTSGIPLAGGVATTVVSTSKLVSGGKSLALGFASGIVLNLIGKSVDKLRKKHSKQKQIV